MTPEDLDVFLRTPTEHEARYLKGWQNPDVLQQLEVVEDPASPQQYADAVWRKTLSLLGISGASSSVDRVQLHVFRQLYSDGERCAGGVEAGTNATAQL